MTKFHINKHGVPAPCKAKLGNCPLGGDDTHFKTKQDAQDFVDKQAESTHGLLGKLPQEARDLASNRVFKVPNSFSSITDLEIFDPHRYLNEDLSVDIAPGKYRVIFDDGVINTYMGDEDSFTDEYAFKMEDAEPVLTSSEMELKVIEVHGEKIYNTFNFQGHLSHPPTILIPEKIYGMLEYEGVIDNSLYGQPPAITIKKPTSLAMDPTLTHEYWENQDEEDPRYYGFHFTESGSYEDEENILTKEKNDRLNNVDKF